MALIARKRNEQRRPKKSCKHNKQHSFKNKHKFLCEIRIFRKELLGIRLKDLRCYKFIEIKWNKIWKSITNQKS